MTREAGRQAQRGYQVRPFTPNRRMVVASASVGRERNTIHTLLEVDISEARRIMGKHRERTGERLSLTAYVVTCLARAVAENPEFNSIRKGGHLILLDDVTVSVLVERDLSGEKVPEPFGIRAAQNKTYRDIHEEIRAAQENTDDRLGGLSGIGWVRFIPGFLLRSFVRLASHSVRMAERFGVISVTAVGMFSRGAMWGIPLSGATVAVTVGGIVRRPVVPQAGGSLENREHLCLTISFDHDIIDGAPGARFTKRLAELLESGDALRREVEVRA